MVIGDDVVAQRWRCEFSSFTARQSVLGTIPAQRALVHCAHTEHILNKCTLQLASDGLGAGPCEEHGHGDRRRRRLALIRGR